MSADTKVDQPNISKHECELTDSDERPSYLYKEDGLLKFRQGQVIEGGAGEYNIVWDFKSSRDSLSEEVPVEERITKNTDAKLTFLGFDDPEISALMAELTQIANDPSKSYENEQDRAEYRAHLGKVYKSLAAKVKTRLNDEKALFFPPKNGGIFVQEVFEEVGIVASDFYNYRMSRVLAIDENGQKHLNVAAKFAADNPDIDAYQTFVFADDCIASDISSTATLEYIAAQLRASGIDPSHARVIIAVSAASQRGVESLLSDEAREDFGFGSIEVIAAMPVYKLTDEFYLQELDGSYTVGDMGRWTVK